jgi:hypothetical protein
VQKKYSIWVSKGEATDANGRKVADVMGDFEK